MCSGHVQKPKSHRTSDRSDAKTVPFVLRYTAVTATAWSRALRLAPVPKELGVSLVPAWKNALPTVSSIISRSNNGLCKGMIREGYGGHVAAVGPPRGNSYMSYLWEVQQQQHARHNPP